MTIEMAQDVWYLCDIGFGPYPQIMCRRGEDHLDRVDSDLPFPVEDKDCPEKLNCYVQKTYVYSLQDIAQAEPLSMQLAEHCESLRETWAY
jgi:hypothetical protein